MSRQRFLVLGGGEGWHGDQLAAAAESNDVELSFASYESLSSHILGNGKSRPRCDAGPLDEFDAVLTRTMPAGSLERVTFRLSILHDLVHRIPIINPPRSLEIAIDKFATLAHVGSLGYEVPETIVAQTRREALDAFDRLGGDCVLKPIFGGEGRGVTRVRDRELAWYAFATLDQLDSVMYVQKFVSPGGADTRLLVIGDEVIGVRRTNSIGFRTNQLAGAGSRPTDLSPWQTRSALHIAKSIGLSLAAIDVLDCDDGDPRVLEVNAIPGWRAAQSVVEASLADRIIQLLIRQCSEGISHA